MKTDTEDLKAFLHFITVHTTGFEKNYRVGITWDYKHEDGHFEKVTNQELIHLFTLHQISK